MVSNPEELNSESQTEPVNPGVERRSADEFALTAKIDEVTDSLIYNGLIDADAARAIVESDLSNVSKLNRLNQLNPSFIKLILSISPTSQPPIIARLYSISLGQVAQDLGGDKLVDRVADAARPAADSTMPNLSRLQQELGQSGDVFTQMALLNILRQAPETVGPMLLESMLTVLDRLIAQGQADPVQVRFIMDSNRFDIDVLEGLNKTYPGFTNLVLVQMLGGDSAETDQTEAAVADDNQAPSKRRIFHRRDE